MASLSAPARRRAADRVVVVAGLWGALRPTDRIPPYRLNVCSRLVGMPALEPMWRRVLPAVLVRAAGRGLVVDCRSSSYRSMGAPTDLAPRTAVVRVVRDEAGRRSVASHDAKRTRGEVTRFLLESGADPGTPEGLAEALAARWPTELAPPARASQPWTIDVVERVRRGERAAGPARSRPGADEPVHPRA